MHIAIGRKPFLVVRSHPHLIMTIEFFILQLQRLLNAQRKPSLLDQDYNHWSVGENSMLYHGIQQEPISTFNFFFFFCFHFSTLFHLFHFETYWYMIFYWKIVTFSFLILSMWTILTYCMHVNYIVYNGNINVFLSKLNDLV